MNGTPVINLNELRIDDDSRDGRPQEHYQAGAEDDSIVVVFKHLESSLIYHIRCADVIVGCVAWLTNEKILRALSTKRGVALIVQKEDFQKTSLFDGRAVAKLNNFKEAAPYIKTYILVAKFEQARKRVFFD